MPSQNGRLRVHLGVADPAMRRRLAAALHADADIVLVAEPEAADLVLAERVAPTGAPAAVSPSDGALTSREHTVLQLMAEGLGNKEIGSRLDISAHTVKFHVASVLAKLGARSRTEAVSAGLRRGLLTL